MLARMQISLAALTLCLAGAVHAAKGTFSVNNLPDTWEDGQSGTNQCDKYGKSSQKSQCQNLYINSATDFCLWGPPQANSSVGKKEADVVSYCTKEGYGTRLIPNGALKGAHFVKTSKFVQVTGKGDFTFIGIAKGDGGGELDPHGANNKGNPVGGLVFSRNIEGHEGEFVQIKEWNNFINDKEFSFRGCYGDDAAEYCPHIYDEMGDYFNSPGNYDKGVFEDCSGEPGHKPGIYGTSTFYQGDQRTPDAHAPGKTSNCHTHHTVAVGPAKQKVVKRRFGLRNVLQH
ncbi:hypothetical protein MVES1_001043 [Malassezia vespertilionis]|uniref:Uncharacterized protein n=1 Tax=Malassezia vespertilionis TaxID=2020962 RepID=A0A2N1JF34_9BASI|nr:uncharacterized protein MVES1_001043 [Malassezia vespertilionis]PKI85126.1 hypothetical protein MVES_000983 [Malassezia vespertilionis]WFD05710.1 hypothetical protein MVES1_001043 [Malassezia vespertilionis]